MKDLSIYTNDFINYCRLHKGLSAKTLRAYSIDLNQLWERTHGDLSKASICRYISHLHKSYKPRTCRRKIAVIKAFVHFLLIDDIIDSNPFDKIDASFREPSLLPRTIPLSIINGILKAAYNERKLAKTPIRTKCACVTSPFWKCSLPQAQGCRKCAPLLPMTLIWSTIPSGYSAKAQGSA